MNINKTICTHTKKIRNKKIGIKLQNVCGEPRGLSGKVRGNKYYTDLGLNHRHLSNIDCLRFVMCPLLVPVFLGFFFCCGH